MRGQEHLALVLIIFAPALDTMVRGLVHHLTPPLQGDGPVARRAWLDTQRSYVRIGRVLLVVSLVLIIARLWGLSLQNIAAAGLGARFAASVIEALLLLSFGTPMYETNTTENR